MNVETILHIFIIYVHNFLPLGVRNVSRRLEIDINCLKDFFFGSKLKQLYNNANVIFFHFRFSLSCYSGHEWTFKYLRLG